MSLDTQILQFPLTAGLNEGVDPRSASPGTIVRMANCEWAKDGLLQTRSGVTALSTSGLSGFTSALRLLVRSDELCVTDGASLWSYDRTAWVNTGPVPACEVTSVVAAAPIDGVCAADQAVLTNGNIVQAVVASDPLNLTEGAIHYQILDPSTGASPIVGPTVLNGGSGAAKSVRVITNGTNYAILWTQSDGKLYYSFNGAFGVALKTDLFAIFGNPFDAIMVEPSASPPTWMVAYERSSGTSSVIAIEKYTLAATPSSVASSTVGSETGRGTTHRSFTSISLAGATAETIYLGYAGVSSTDTSKASALLAGFSSTLGAQTLAATLVDQGTKATTVHANLGLLRLDATHVIYGFSTFSAGGSVDQGLFSHVVISNAGVRTVQRYSVGTNLISRPFALNGKFYAVAADMMFSVSFTGGDGINPDGYGYAGRPSPPGFNTYLLKLDTVDPASAPQVHRYEGNLDVLIGGTWGPGLSLTDTATFTTGGHVSNTVQVDGAVFVLVPYQQDAPSVSNTFQQGVRRLKIVSPPSSEGDTYRNISISGEAYAAGAFLTAYDGRRPFDFGFPRSSSINIYASAMVGSGGHLTAGNYQYTVVAKFQSAAGITHRSPVAPPLSYTAMTNDSMVLVLMPQVQAWKGNSSSLVVEPLRVMSELYRTTQDGENLQRLTFSPTYNVLMNDPMIVNTFTDSVSDSNITPLLAGTLIQLDARPVVYNAGELDDYAPPAALSIHLHRGRIFLIALDKRTVWVSKNYLDDPGVAPGFHPTEILTFDEDLTGLSSIDDKLIIFSAESIWYVTGAGAAPDGSESDYEPIKLQVDSGCTNGRSIVAMPEGVLFQSGRGIYLLSRDLNISWKGKGIQDDIALFPFVTSAVLVDAKNQVRFTCNDQVGPNAGIVLVYDYIRGQWSRFEYTGVGVAGQGAVARVPIMDACIWQGAYTFVTPSGNVYQESTSTFDDGAFIVMDFETAEIFGQGPLSADRIRRAYILASVLGDGTYAPGATLTVYKDGGVSADQTRVWSGAEIFTIGNGNLGVHIKSQKAESLRLRFTSAMTSGLTNGAGFKVSALSFEVGSKKGMEKRPATQRK